mmetsp:Transcript_6629/g.18095  ORF Transcript_6629/g.18095 Transcript_6629/m.18095 type:complete len:237 (-) Transcript_6629:418-1128(-)
MLHSNLVADNVEAKHASVLVEQAESLKLICATNAHLVCNSIHDAVSRDIPRDEPLTFLVGAHDRLHDHEGHRVWALPRNTLPTDRNVRSRTHFVVAVDELRTTEVRLRQERDWRAGLHPTQCRSCQLDKLLVLHRTCSSEHHLVSSVVVVHIAPQVRLREGLNAVKGSDAREAQRVVAECAGVEPVINHCTRGLIQLVQLPQDTLLLLREVGNRWASHQVCQDVNTLLHILLADGD